MGLTFTKKKIAEANASQSAAAASIAEKLNNKPLSGMAELIDMAGTLQTEAEAIKARIKTEQDKLKPLAAAMAELQDAVDKIDEDDDTEGLVEFGELYKVEIGKKGTSREIADMQAVAKKLGKDVFMQVAKVTLKDIDKYLSGNEKDALLNITRTSRSLKLIKRA